MTLSQPDGYLALPPGGTGEGVLVLHAWWGLNGTIKAFCDRLAASGFVAFAPDLYHGQVADDIPGAETLSSALSANYNQARAEIAEAARYLYERVGRPASGLAVIGFSLGAFYALDLSDAAPELIDSVVVFYGTGSDEFSKARASFWATSRPTIPTSRWNTSTTWSSPCATPAARSPFTATPAQATGSLSRTARTPLTPQRRSWPGNARWPFCATKRARRTA